MDEVERRFWKYTAAAALPPLRPGVQGRCDLWVGAKVRSRSGSKTPVMHAGRRAERRTIYPHVWAWEREHGPRPPHTMLTPACGHSLCVNPEHRELRPRGAHRRHPEPANAS